jgi:hypothetical protein
MNIKSIRRIHLIYCQYLKFFIMKKHLLFLSMLVLMFSCQNQGELEQYSPEGLEELSTRSVVYNDSIVPLDSTLFPEKPESSVRLASVFDHLYQLNGLSFYLQPKSVYQGLNTLQTTSLGQEVVLAARIPGNTSQLFYLQFLPASTGIPYLIRSQALGEVIGAGSYASDPNTYVLYTRNSGSTSLFGFSWDFYLNSAEDGYILENQDLIGSGPGGPWDIYHYALQAYNGNLSFVRRNNSSIFQQFNIVVDDEFTIKDVVLDVNAAMITATAPYILRSGTVSNNTSNNVTQNLTFTESEGETSSFRETNGITTYKTGSLNLGIKLFEVVDIGGSYSVQSGASQTIEYGQNSQRTITVSDSYTITIPPQTVVSYDYTAMRHQVNMPYTAILEGQSNNVIESTGVYTGVDYSSTYLDVTETPMAGRSGTPRTYRVYPDSQ